LHPVFFTSDDEKSSQLEARRRGGHSVEDGWVDTFGTKLFSTFAGRAPLVRESSFLVFGGADIRIACSGEFILHPVFFTSDDEKSSQLEARRRGGHSVEDGWVQPC
jgi:hypothetical protein